MGEYQSFLQIAESLKPKLFYQQVEVVGCVPIEKIAGGTVALSPAGECRGLELRQGDPLCLDFGRHLVGRLTLHLGFSGSHPDSPIWLRLRFAERPCELLERLEDYHGWISLSWVQQEDLHADVLPTVVELPRRYAFRYLRLELLAGGGSCSVMLENALCHTCTSADWGRLAPYTGPYRELDRIACNTLSSCMQEVFEDGPKRDRRLWLGDLRLQALANYHTFQNNELVRRCLYLFAALPLDDGRVSSCIFLEPKPENGGAALFDYSLLFIPTLLDYWQTTGDQYTVNDLWPTAQRQINLVQNQFDKTGLIRDPKTVDWCFIDWSLKLNKQAAAQGCYLYCVNAAVQLAQALGKHLQAEALTADYRCKKEAAQALWDHELGIFISGKDRQLSWASQIWMILGGAVDQKAGADLLQRMEKLDGIQGMVTPYLYHHYVEALATVGLREKAQQMLVHYWGGMADQGADTFWEMYDPGNPDASPYGGTIVNSYCHAWSCGPAYFLRGRKLFREEKT